MSKKEKRPNLDLLQSVLHNSEIGVLSINYLISSVKSQNFEDEIKKQRAGFLEIANKTKQIASVFGYNLKPNGAFKKMKMWMAIKTSCCFNKKTQHLAELMVFGSFMGKINMIKSLADCNNSKQECLEIARELKDFEEKNLNDLIPFLERAKD